MKAASKNIAVIGGGTAGLAAAAAAAEGGARVSVFEASAKPGRKIVLAGNGRCNLAACDYSDGVYDGEDAAFASRFMRERGLGLFYDLMDTCGILTRRVRDGIYPYSEEAPSVLRALLSKAEALPVTVRNNTAVRSISQTDGKWKIMTDGWEYGAERVIVCCGSDAHFEDRDASSLLAAVCSATGHTAVKPYPALVPLIFSGEAHAPWAGARARGRVTVSADGTELAASEGQIQFTAYGISGIPVLDVSGRAAMALAEGRQVLAELDLMPDHTEREIVRLFEKKAAAAGRTDARTLFYGILPERTALVLASLAAHEGDFEAYARVLKHSVWSVKGTRPAKEAQCMGGGIRTAEIDPETFASLRADGLYFAGEALDVCGICGGYNLSFAFASGALCGKEAARDQDR